MMQGSSPRRTRRFSGLIVGNPFFALALSAALLGVPARASAQRSDGPAATAPRKRLGEAYTWNMRILGLFDAGRARLAIAPPYKNGNGWQVNVVGEAEATGLVKALTGLHDEYRVVLDGSTLLPRRMDINETGISTRTVATLFDGKSFDVTAKKPGMERRLTGQLPTEPLEPVAVLLLLRAARLQKGDRLELILVDGTAFYQGSVEVVGREELPTAIGVHKAIRLLCRGERINEKGQKVGRPPRQATLWLSDDQYRVPLRVEAQTDYGTGQFELQSFEPARRPIIPKRMAGITEIKLQQEAEAGQ